MTLKIRHYAFTAFISAALFLTILSVVPAIAQKDGAHARTVVTVEGSQATVPREAVTLSVKEGKAHVSEFTPYRGDDAGLQLLILIDDSARRSLSLQYDDVKNFIMSLPPSAQVGVAYMQNGSARFAQEYTADHARAAAALRIPSGSPGSNGSPYFVLSDLVKRWPTEERAGAPPLRPGVIRREVLMFTNGVEVYDSGRFDPQNPYVTKAIEDSLRAGVIVYAIYVRDVGFGGLGDAEANNGQNYLVQVTQATGGKAYYIGNSTPPDFRPFLNDLKKKLDNQYRLGFTVDLKRRTQAVSLKVKVKNAKVYAPVRAYLDQPQ